MFNYFTESKIKEFKKIVEENMSFRYVLLDMEKMIDSLTHLIHDQSSKSMSGEKNYFDKYNESYKKFRNQHFYFSDIRKKGDTKLLYKAIYSEIRTLHSGGIEFKDLKNKLMSKYHLDYPILIDQSIRSLKYIRENKEGRTKSEVAYDVLKKKIKELSK